jgi:DNA polymerase phi
MPALRESLVDLATKACTDDKAKLTAPQMKEVLKLALVAARQTKRFAEASLTEIWQPDLWSTLKQSLAQSSRFSSSTGLHKICDQMVQSTGGQSKAKTKERSKEKKAEGTGEKSPVKRKRIADEEEDAAGPEPKVKAKKAKKAKVSS